MIPSMFGNGTVIGRFFVLFTLIPLLSRDLQAATFLVGLPEGYVVSHVSVHHCEYFL